MAPSLLRLAPRSTPTASNHPARSHAPSRAVRGGSSTSASRAWLRRSIPASCVALFLLLLTASLLRARIRRRSPEVGGCAGTRDGECSGVGGSSEAERPLRVYVVLLPAPYNVDLIPLAQVTHAPRDSPGFNASHAGGSSDPAALPPHLLPFLGTPDLPDLPDLPLPLSPSPPAAAAEAGEERAALPESGGPVPPSPSFQVPPSLHSHLLSFSLLVSSHLNLSHLLPPPTHPSFSPLRAALLSTVSLPRVRDASLGLPGSPAVQRVQRVEEAEVVFLPYWSTLSLPPTLSPLRAALPSTVPLPMPVASPSTPPGTRAVQRVQRVEDAEVLFLPYWSTLAFRTNASEILDPIIARFARRHAATATTAASIPANTTHDSSGSSESSSSIGSRGSGSGGGRMPPLVVPCVYPLAMFNHSLPLAAAIKLAVDLDLHWAQAASFDRDVVVPYVPLVAPFTHDRGSWSHRPLLLFFQGTTDRWGGGIIRQQVQRELQGQPGVQFTVGRAENSSMTAQAGTSMRRAKYCLVPRGDTSSSCRLFDAMLSGCIPVIISDALDPPFEDAIDFTAFSLLLPAALAVRPGYILRMLHRQTEAVWRQQWKAMRKVAHHFIYSFPPRPGGAEDMVWRAVARRVRGQFSPRYRNRRGRILLALLAQAGLNASHLQQPLPNRPPVTFDVTIDTETN
ncbi:unnamed protein product [Closterium sp. Naga37s-1]|nr:unnamed protein product [Closterium sp. Naga37s-1]